MRMRLVDTSQLKPLGPEDFGPWLIEDGQLLRTSWNRSPIRSERRAQELFDLYAAVHEAGVGAPEPYEVVRTADGFGVIVEFVKGVPLSTHLIVGSYTPKEVGAAIAEIAKRLHAHTTESGRDWKDFSLSLARAKAELFPDDELEDLLALIDEVPESSCLLHGDLHAANIIVSRGKLGIIDLEDAGYGHPLFDLAIARGNIMFSMKARQALGVADTERLEAMRNAMWSSVIENYFEDASADELEALDAKLERLASLIR